VVTASIPDNVLKAAEQARSRPQLGDMMEKGVVERDAGTDDPRWPYEAPELVDCGDVASLTQSAFVTAGSDSGYS
jgi:hypothetical protein